MKIKTRYLLTALALIVFLLFAYGSKEEEINPAELDSEAFVISQHFVKQRLRSPSTADFPFLDYTSVHLDSGRYKVTSYVDAQNAFGGEVRTYYKAILKYNSGDWADYRSWTLEDLKLNQ